MKGFQNNFFQTTFHHHFQAKIDIFGNRFHFEGKNDVGISQVRRVNMGAICLSPKSVVAASLCICLSTIFFSLIAPVAMINRAFFTNSCYDLRFTISHLEKKIANHSYFALRKRKLLTWYIFMKKEKNKYLQRYF